MTWLADSRFASVKITSLLYEPQTSELLEDPVNDPNYKPNKTITGIPEFWLKVFKNSEMVEGWVEDTDEAVLKKLKNIYLEFPEETPPSEGLRTDDKFSIIFEFNKNEYFVNEKLQKTYWLEPNVDKDGNPFEYTGVTVKKTEGSEIQWKANRDLTCEIISKKQRNAKTGQTRVVNRG